MLFVFIVRIANWSPPPFVVNDPVDFVLVIDVVGDVLVRFVGILDVAPVHAGEDIDVLEVLGLQALATRDTGIRYQGAVRIERHRVVAAGELCLDRRAVGTGDVLAGENDVGQARVLFVQRGTKQR